MIALRNVLLIVLINGVYVQAQGTLDGASQALQELGALASAIQADMYINVLNPQADIMRVEVYAQSEEAVQKVVDEVANITRKILAMAESISTATGRSVSDCVRSSESDLRTFSEEWRNRAGECSGHMIMTGNDLLYTAWTRLWYEYDIDYYCSQLIFNECEQFQEEQCSDAVIRSIKGATTSMNRSIELFRAELSNQIIGMHFSCMDMVNQALAIYPPLILEYAKSCFDEIVASSYVFSC